MGARFGGDRPREEFRGVDHCIRCGHPLDDEDGFYCLVCLYATEAILAAAEEAHTDAGDPDIDVDEPEMKDEL